MATARVTWQEKVRRVLQGDAPELPRGAIPRLAKKLGRDRRLVTYWLTDDRSPRNETRVVPQIAAALGVDADWLTDGKDTPARPAVDRIPGETFTRVPVKYRRLLFALADVETADWLLAQLDLYERARQGRKPPR